MPEPETVVEGQETGQEVQPEIQPEAAVAPDDGMYVRIPRTNFSHLTDDGDFNKVVHMGNQYRDAEKSGLVALGQALAGAGMDPYTFLAEWNKGEEAPGQTPQPQAQPQPQPGQQEGQQGQWVTSEQMQQTVAEQVKQQMSQGFQEQRQQADTDSARHTQDAAVDAACDSLGYKAQPTKFSLAGTDHELTPFRDIVVRPAVVLTAQRIHAQGLNPNAPDYEQRLYAPMSEKTIKEAAEHVKQVLALYGQQQLEADADNQADLPQGTLAQGAPGGRARKAPEDMTEAEIKALVNTHVAQAKAKRGG